MINSEPPVQAGPLAADPLLMPVSLAFKSDVPATLNRFRRFFREPERDRGRVLIQVDLNNGNERKTPLPDLRHYSWPEELQRYLDDYLAYWDREFKSRLCPFDDALPVITIHLGPGVESAALGTGFSLWEDTSWSLPTINDWRDLEKLHLDTNNRWLTLLLQGLEYLRAREESRFGVTFIGAHSPLDLAAAFRGASLLTDFYEHPREVHELLEFCTEATIWFREQQAGILGRPGGMFVGLIDAWHPTSAIMFRQDEACLCSKEAYARFSAPYSQEVIDRVGAGVPHLHSTGLQIVPEVLKLKNLAVLQITDDPGHARAFDSLSELMDLARGVPLCVSCRPEEVPAGVGTARGRGNVIFKTWAADTAQAERLVETARAQWE